MSAQPATKRFISDPSVIEALASDLANVQLGKFPDQAVLEDAPVLHDWSIVSTMCGALHGQVMGHPLLGSERTIVTSPIFAFDLEHGWARTRSRLYRLGIRADL